MKKTLFPAFLLFFMSLFGAITVEAQYWIVGFSQTNIDQSARRVQAKSGTFVDYYIAYDYLPRVHYGDIYRTDDPETSYSTVSGSGYPHQLVIDGIPTSLIGIGFDHSTSNYVPGKTYCTYTTHWVGAYEYYVNGGYYYYDPLRISMFSSTGGGSQYPWTFYNPVYYMAVFRWYRLGPTQECKAVPYDPPTITSVTPNGGQEGSVVPVVITGSNFISPQVTVSGGGVTANVVTSTPNTITATLTIAPGTDLTNRDLKVSASGGTSGAATFKIGDHTPSAQSSTPNEGNMGATIPVTINGSYFGGAPELIVEGAGVTASVLSSSSSQIQANVVIDSNTTEGNRLIKVRSKGRSGGGFIMTPGASDTSNGLNFTVKRPPNPTLTINEVGFGGDHQVYRYPGYLGATSAGPIEDITWIRNASTNANNSVAYNKDAAPASMSLKGKFTVDPAPAPDQNVNIKIRVKRGGAEVAVSDGTVPVTGSTVDFENVKFTSGLESTAEVKKATYDFDWEVSFDNGQNWVAAGSSQGHTVYWTYADPQGTGCTAANLWECTFPLKQGTEGDSYLYNYALEIATAALSSSTQTPETIAKAISLAVDTKFAYDPSFINPDNFHPLEMYVRFNGTGNNNFSKAQCSANANLVTGLLRSVGVPTQTIYVWGGMSDNESRDGGPRFFYNWQPVAGENYQQSFMVKRPRSSERGYVVDPDPHFTFHALVRVNGQYFDPSYEAKLPGNIGSSFSFIETIFYNGTSWEFKKFAETTSYITRAYVLRPVTYPAPNVCEHRYRTSSLPHSFDHDHKADVAVWRPSDGIWYIINSADGTLSYVQFGQSGDKITPGDYDGDGRADMSVYRPSNNTWYWINSATQTFSYEVYGNAHSAPISGDFDGDRKTDLAVRITDPNSADPSVFQIKQSSDGTLRTVNFGLVKARPVEGDFDGDGKTDVALFEHGTTWNILNSSTNQITTVSFGQKFDIPTPSDFDGDGRTDIAVFRPSTGTWWVLKSSDNNHYAVQYGSAQSVPVAADYDGDGKADLAVFDAGMWNILQSTTTTTVSYQWGYSTDNPIPAAFR